MSTAPSAPTSACRSSTSRSSWGWRGSGDEGGREEAGRMLNILVLVKLVPDTVEELEIAPDGRSLDPASVRLILSERDEHALEQGLLLKERYGGTLTVIALDVPEVDDVLFTALAKGADRAVKITGMEPGPSTWTAAGLT